MQKLTSYIIRFPDNNEPALCVKCMQDKPISEYYFHSLRSDGAKRYRPYCKSCRQIGPRTSWSRPIHSKIIETGKQICIHCNTEKKIEEFYSNGCFKDGIKKYRTSCKKCVLDRAKINSPEICRTKAQIRSSSPKNFIASILNHAAKRKQHLGFDLDLGYLINLYEIQAGQCALSGVKMTHTAGLGRVNTNISLDRIDSSKGYLRGNVQFVCRVVNIIKQDMDKKELCDWCIKIYKHSNEKI